MPDKKQPTRTRTQKGAAKNDRNAIRRAEEHRISTSEIVKKMACNRAGSDNPSEMDIAAAAFGLAHVRANMNYQCPIYDAVTEIIDTKEAQRKADKAVRREEDDFNGFEILLEV